MTTCQAEACDGEWHECPHCGGEGCILDDCFEDTCCCADPETEHDLVVCEFCRGEGGWHCPVLSGRLGDNALDDAGAKDRAVNPSPKDV